jgi:hypothetical protein
MNKQANRYLENHFRFSGESNSNSVEISLEENPIPTLDPVFVVPEHLVGFSDVPKRDLPLGQGHDIEAGVHFCNRSRRFFLSLQFTKSCVLTVSRKDLLDVD